MIGPLVPFAAAGLLALLAACVAQPALPPAGPPAPASPAGMAAPSAAPTAMAAPATQVPTPTATAVAPPEPPRPHLTLDFGTRNPPAFGEPALVRGAAFTPGRYTLWIGPPRGELPTCVPADAAALETVQVGATGELAHGFTMREDFGGGWRLLANGYARIYAAPGDGRCGTPPAFVDLPLAGYRAGIPPAGSSAPCPASGGESGPTPLLTFFAPATAPVGRPVPLVMHIPLADSCWRACPDAARADVDRATRTVTLRAGTFRPVPMGCLASGGEAALEIPFTPDAPGDWTIVADVVEGLGGSREHLALSRTEGRWPQARWTLTVR